MAIYKGCYGLEHVETKRVVKLLHLLLNMKGERRLGLGGDGRRNECPGRMPALGLAAFHCAGLSFVLRWSAAV